jgi:3-oxoacyl-[acyl-carrier protein] reductase
MTGLTGKIALVTGASRGIGRGIAERLAHDGALVAVNYAQSAAKAADVVAGIEADGGQALMVPGDVGSETGIAELFAALDAGLAARGLPAQIDILVNNAGISVMGPPTVADRASFARTMAVNVEGPFFVTQQALGRLRDGGRVINISSSVTERPFPIYAAYSMSKAALNAFTILLAQELGPRGITVNAIGPGFIETDMSAELAKLPGVVDKFIEITALGRLGRVADVADVVALLASDDARWITAQYIGVHGGARL